MEVTYSPMACRWPLYRSGSVTQNVYTTATIYAHAMPGGDEEAAGNGTSIKKPKGEEKFSGPKLV